MRPAVAVGAPRTSRAQACVLPWWLFAPPTRAGQAAGDRATSSGARMRRLPARALRCGADITAIVIQRGLGSLRFAFAFSVIFDFRWSLLQYAALCSRKVPVNAAV